MSELARKMTLGADPEIAIALAIDPKATKEQIYGGPRIVPVCGLFGGEKGAALPQGQLGGWLEDGVMLELNPAPALTAEGLSYNTFNLLTRAQEYLNQKYPHPNTKSMRGSKYLLKYPGRAYRYERSDLDKDPRASVFGCAGDFSAYNLGEERTGVMDKAMAEWDNNIRFAGGHVHLGLDPWPEELPKWIVVRLLDLLLGMPSARRWGESAGEREPYYGLAGLYRETKYGVEYRTPSNRWLAETGGTPWFLQRLESIGEVLKNYERTKDALVDLYNSVDWGTFNQVFSARQYGDIPEALGKAETIQVQKVDYIRLGDLAYCISNHSISVCEYSALAKSVTVVVPQRQRGIIAEMRLEEQEEPLPEDEEMLPLDPEPQPPPAPDEVADLVAEIDAAQRRWERGGRNGR